MLSDHANAVGFKRVTVVWSGFEPDLDSGLLASKQQVLLMITRDVTGRMEKSRREMEGRVGRESLVEREITLSALLQHRQTAEL